MYHYVHKLLYLTMKCSFVRICPLSPSHPGSCDFLIIRFVAICSRYDHSQCSQRSLFKMEERGMLVLYMPMYFLVCIYKAFVYDDYLRCRVHTLCVCIMSSVYMNILWCSILHIFTPIIENTSNAFANEVPVCQNMPVYTRMNTRTLARAVWVCNTSYL
jgi:hypothetical protein